MVLVWTCRQSNLFQVRNIEGACYVLLHVHVKQNMLLLDTLSNRGNYITHSMAKINVRFILLDEVYL